MQLEAAYEKAAVAEMEIREALAEETQTLLRDMDAGYKVQLRRLLEIR